jgi:hypothetical protein
VSNDELVREYDEGLEIASIGNSSVEWELCKKHARNYSDLKAIYPSDTFK